MNDRKRSPSFPFIPLGTAIQRLKEFDEYFRRHPAPIEKTGLAWGMKEKSSQAYQTTAALRAYGLLEYVGDKDNRKAQITENGRTYLRAQQEYIKLKLLKQAALLPKEIRKFWDVWGADRPPEEVCLDELILNNDYTDSAAQTFLKVYDETIAYAGLRDSDKIPGEDGVDAAETSHNDEDEAENPPSSKRGRKRERKPGMREDVYTLDEGDVVFQWPDTISEESYEEIESWAKLILRKMKRHVVDNSDESQQPLNEEDSDNRD